ncbi:MAG: MFS transporter [Planctomycetota bacterium]|nr:MAG: MFS transporter [Planctomycetota bacterium]REJ89840.1 MAG: MFS transporter [Planctomycetota bacterium]
MSFVAARLSVMMFLQFFLWGAWYVTAYLYLGSIGFGGSQIKWTYSVGPIAGMISPFFVGMIADRFFSTERVLAVMHLLGGGAMVAAIGAMGGENPSPTVINLLFFAHMLCYFPTLALTNSLALHNMTDAKREFPLIRVFGTIGWIFAGLTLSLFAWDGAINMFYLAASASFVMGLYCFTLPHTPPPMAGQTISVREVLGLDALVLLRQRPYLIFMICSFLICIPLAFYYQLATKFADASGLSNPAAQMSFGQMSEIVFMLVMPLFFARLGVKWMLAVGMLCWVIRYGLFTGAAADGTYWMVLGGIVLHGICYDFFFVTGQIYTDTVAPSSIRSQAQGMLVLFTIGFGMLIGAQAAGVVEEAYTPPTINVDDPEVVANLTNLIAGSEEGGRELAAMLKKGEDRLPVMKSWIERAEAELAGRDATAEAGATAADGEGDADTSRIGKLEAQLPAMRNSLPVLEASDIATKIGGLKTEIDKLAGRYTDEDSNILDRAVAMWRFLFPSYASSSEREEAERLAAEVSPLRAERSELLLTTKNWRMIWLIPAIGAAIVLVLFVLIFKEDTPTPEISEADVAEAAAREENP